jgi:pantothenate kinase
MSGYTKGGSETSATIKMVEELQNALPQAVESGGTVQGATTQCFQKQEFLQDHQDFHEVKNDPMALLIQMLQQEREERRREVQQLKEENQTTPAVEGRAPEEHPASRGGAPE